MKPMLTCRTFLGTSCLCTNALHSRCIGIRPNGLGLLLKFLQYADPNPCGCALFGERKPFSLGTPFGFLTSSIFRLVGFGTGMVLVVEPDDMPPFIVMAVGLREICGLRLLLRARKSSGSFSSCFSPSAYSSIGSTELLRWVLDLVVGGK